MGESHIPGIARLHFPHPPRQHGGAGKAIFPPGRQSGVAAETGGQLGISSGLEWPRAWGQQELGGNRGKDGQDRGV